MDNRTAKGLHWFKTVMMYAGFFWLFKLIFGLFAHNPGYEVAMALMSFMGSIFVLGVPAYAIGWMTAAPSQQEIKTDIVSVESSKSTNASAQHFHSSVLADTKEKNAMGRSYESNQQVMAADNAFSETDDEIEIRLYATAAEELEKKLVVKGLWTKFLVQTNGDENATKLAYLKARFIQLKAQEDSKRASLLNEKRRKILEDEKNQSEIEKAKQSQQILEAQDQKQENQIKEKYCLGHNISQAEIDFLRKRGATWYM